LFIKNLSAIETHLTSDLLQL